MIKSVVLFSLLITICLFLKSCTPEEEYVLVEDIAKSWKISTLTVDNDVISFTEGFNLLLDRKGNQPTTYTITTGGVSYNFAGVTSGSWSLNDNDNPTQATFSGNIVNFTASKEQLTIQYNGVDDASIRFVLIPR